MEAQDILKTAVKAIDEKKGEDIQIIKITDLTIIADYFVIATGNSNTQVKAIADEVEFKLSQGELSLIISKGKKRLGFALITAKW